MHRKAFTLVELLVVIAIIGLLSTVAIFSFNSTKANARNTRREADLKQIVNAFALGVAANGSMPQTGVNAWYCLSPQCTGAWASYTANATVDAFLAPYLAQKPVDPPDNVRGLAGYHYNGNWVGGIFGTGSYIEYAVEVTPNTQSCPLGGFWFTDGKRIQCMIRLDN